jgi:hypothetical protein
MSVKVLHKVYWLFLALIVLVSSVGLSLDVHYCNEEFKSFSFFGKAKQCHTTTISCPHHAAMEFQNESNNSCCSNQTLEVEEIDFDYYTLEKKEITDVQVSCKHFIFASFLVDLRHEATESVFLENQVLLPSMDIYVQLGRFLI